jgi:RNA polymerase sigma-70 factor (ECF subfamily)
MGSLGEATYVEDAPDGLATTRELALTRSVASGDKRACDEFARRLLPTVRRVTRALLRGSDGANDAAQVSLMELLSSASNYSGLGALEAWAQRIATRSTLRWMDKQKRVVTRVEEIETQTLQCELQTELLDRLPRPLDEYLDQITDVQRVAILLRFVMGHTIPEIAALTDTPIPTVKSRIQKGHQTLSRLVRRDLNLGVRRPDELAD